jgi:hypothetical protein
VPVTTRDGGHGRDLKETKMITNCDGWFDKGLECVLRKNESWTEE